MRFLAAFMPTRLEHSCEINHSPSKSPPRSNRICGFIRKDSTRAAGYTHQKTDFPSFFFRTCLILSSSNIWFYCSPAFPGTKHCLLPSPSMYMNTHRHAHWNNNHVDITKSSYIVFALFTKINRVGVSWDEMSKTQFVCCSYCDG